MKICFDMDGTIADLYNVPNWLDSLRAESVLPYVVAKPLVDMKILADELNRLQSLGHEIAIISWLSKNSSPSYEEAVTIAKYQWLLEHMPTVKFDLYAFVPYGTPKHEVCSGILFDDNAEVRSAWGHGAHDVQNIIEVLRGI